MFVRFDCGCQGIRMDGLDLVIAPCDYEGDYMTADSSVSFYRRDLSDKSVTKLNDAKASELIDKVARLVGDGHRFRTIKGLLS